MEYVLLALIVINLLILGVIWFLISQKNEAGLEQKIRQLIQEEFKENRKELAQGLRDNREELNRSIKTLVGTRTQIMLSKLKNVEECL